jgi:asparagine synthase (glutamine-hydrolysing)
MQDLFGALIIDGNVVSNALPPARPNDAAASKVRLQAEHVYQDALVAIALRGWPQDERFRTAPERLLQHLGARYLAVGAAFLRELRGSFAIAVVDYRSSSALIAVDRMGIETLAWSLDGAIFAFGTSASAVADALPIKPPLNRQAVFDFMLGHMVAAPDTAYVGVNRLPPATYLELREGGVQLQRYWTPDFRRPGSSQIEALAAEVLPTLGRAVERCGGTDEASGTFLSGGLDSSTVTGLFAKSRDGNANAFSVAFGVDEYNELSYARLAASRFGCRHHVYEVVPADIVELLPTIAAAYDAPYGNSSAVPTLCCARFAKSNGTDHLLAGDGGDEIFGGNSRYAKHKIFEHYARLPRWLRGGLLEPLATSLHGRSLPWPVSKAVSYVEQARVPLPERFETWNLFYREGMASTFDSEFLASIDVAHPLRRMRETWESCPSPDLLDRMLWYDWKFTLADNDLRKVSRTCELAGVRVSYPMLDEDVVDLSIRVPSNAKISGTDLRTFFKGSVREFLPSEIIAKEKHGFGLPFGQWLKTYGPLQEIIYDSLAGLKRRRIMNDSFVDRIVDEHRSGHASYYGYAIWDMAMLELWLRTHDVPKRTPSHPR